MGASKHLTDALRRPASGVPWQDLLRRAVPGPMFVQVRVRGPPVARRCLAPCVGEGSWEDGGQLRRCLGLEECTAKGVYEFWPQGGRTIEHMSRHVCSSPLWSPLVLRTVRPCCSTAARSADDKMNPWSRAAAASPAGLMVMRSSSFGARRMFVAAGCPPRNMFAFGGRDADQPFAQTTLFRFYDRMYCWASSGGVPLQVDRSPKSARPT